LTKGKKILRGSAALLALVFSYLVIGHFLVAVCSDRISDR
jgi:hypothetical protein